MADEHHLAAAGCELQGVEVASRQALVDLNPAIKGLTRKLSGPAGAHLRAGEADVEVDAEPLQSPSCIPGLTLTLFRQLALGVGLPITGLRVPVPEDPDHA